MSLILLKNTTILIKENIQIIFIRRIDQLFAINISSKINIIMRKNSKGEWIEEDSIRESKEIVPEADSTD